MDNPWLDLPNQAPFIAACDFAALKHPKYRESKPEIRLHLDAFPEPYGGDINTAKVVCLLLNPGFVAADVTMNFANDYWVKEVRANLEHKSEFPFLYLSPKLQETGGYKWWTAKLGPLEKAGVTRSELASGIMMVEFLPYHSVKYADNKPYLPSQYYQFELVKQAISLGKTIIIMRGKRQWLGAVPELVKYPYLELSSVLNVSVSPANLDNKKGVGTFDEVVTTLKSNTL